MPRRSHPNAVIHRMFSNSVGWKEAVRMDKLSLWSFQYPFTVRVLELSGFEIGLLSLG